jgi:hypothetical protein
MKPLLILVVIGLLMILAGWLTFGRNGNQTSINIETKKIEHDTVRAIDRGKELLKKVEHSAQGSSENSGN